MTQSINWELIYKQTQYNYDLHLLNINQYFSNNRHQKAQHTIDIQLTTPDHIYFKCK